jgi:ComF family protein
MAFRSSLFQHLRTATNAILPITCCLCEKPGEAFCQSCLRLFTSNKHLQSLSCVGCGLAKLCDCQTAGWAIDRTFALTNYTPPFDRLITDMKFHGQLYIAKNLGKLLGDFIARQLSEEGLNEFVTIPIPLSGDRFRERGFNQAAQIAKGLALANHSTKLQGLIVRQSAHRAQSLLTRKERLAHLSNAYALVGRAPIAALLVDDVMTTGATLNACAALLKQAGTQRVYAAVIGRTQR